MSVMQIANLFNTAGVAIVALLSVVFSFRYPTPFFRIWTAAYTLFFLVVGLEMVQVMGERSLPLSYVQCLLFASSAWCFFQTGNVLTGRFTRNLPVAIGVIAAFALSLFLLLKGVPYMYAVEPVFLVTGITIFGLGLLFLRRPMATPKAKGVPWLGWPLILFALWPHAFPYALFSMSPLSLLGYWVCGVLNILVGVGMVIYLLDDSWSRFIYEQERQNRLKREFLSVVSHELRTPLSSVLGFSEFLEDELAGPLNDDQKTFVAHIQDGTRRLQRLVDDLLDFSALEGGSLKLERRNVDVRERIASALESMRPQAQKAGITLEEALPSRPIPMVLDPGRLEQVLINLVSNAIKFTPSGGKITVTISSLPQELRVEVRDSGIGIPAELIPRVFDRFFQVDSTNTRERNGVGLGLAISKAIVEAHGGRIGCFSQEGRGSTFWFSLPLSGASDSRLAEVHA
ncbi:Alkaline phosphatase synthesis sensor protein PhoR [compost metagenome]